MHGSNGSYVALKADSNMFLVHLHYSPQGATFRMLVACTVSALTPLTLYNLPDTTLLLFLTPNADYIPHLPCPHLPGP